VEGWIDVSSRDQLIIWLNDAYAMEKALEEVLERHAKDAEGHPDVHARIMRHIDETRGQAATVRGCIESLGGSPSSAKNALAGIFGAMQGMATKPAKDTMVKNALADFATEQFEIACYKALIQSARALGEEEIALKLTGILRQEEEMAAFLEAKLPVAVSEALAEAQA
jgi:ferritin-like metal-binding protein YciE